MWLTGFNLPHILRRRIYVLCSVKYKNTFCLRGTGWNGSPCMLCRFSPIYLRGYKRNNKPTQCCTPCAGVTPVSTVEG
jgi:hypothetical protein